MKISIVTPSFNQDKYLATCIRSVLNQSYYNIEHIIIDGKSTDRSIDILESFKKNDSRLLFISESDSGQGEAVNKGFSLATGEIVAWLNSDDFYFDPNVFKYVINFFDSNPQVDILYGGMAYVNSLNQITNIRIPPKFDYQFLELISYIGNTNTFFRKSVIESNRLDQDFHFVIDHEFMLRVTKQFIAQNSERLFACFRVHDEAKTQTMTEIEKNIERVRRDFIHGIDRNIFLNIRELNARILYKIQLIISNYRFLKIFRKTPPFLPFINNLPLK